MPDGSCSHSISCGAGRPKWYHLSLVETILAEENKYREGSDYEDPAEVIAHMTDYLTANRDKIKAIVGLGDLVTQSIKHVFDQVGVKSGDIPVVGWGNSIDGAQEVLDGYVKAAMWQDPQATSYLPYR